MVTVRVLMDAVDDAFAVTRRGLPDWADPHPDRSPGDEEYSRVTDAGRWRILGARADAWRQALTDLGVASVQHGVTAEWSTGSSTDVTSAERIVPLAADAISLVVARSRLDSVPDAGITLGVGDPVETIAWIPDCGCDACDSGSQDALDELDGYVVAVVEGTFRYLWTGTRHITVTGDGMRRGAGLRGREVDAILADPAGWNEISGAPWLGRTG